MCLHTDSILGIVTTVITVTIFTSVTMLTVVTIGTIVQWVTFKEMHYTILILAPFYNNLSGDLLQKTPCWEVKFSHWSNYYIYFSYYAYCSYNSSMSYFQRNALYYTDISPFLQQFIRGSPSKDSLLRSQICTLIQSQLGVHTETID